MASIEKRKDSYKITVSCGYDAQGKKLRKTITYKPNLYTDKGNRKSDKVIQKEVEQYALRIEQEIRTGEFLAPSEIHVKDFATTYLNECALQTLSPRSIESAIANIKMYEKDIGHMRLTALTTAFLQKYANDLLSRPCGNNPNRTLAPSSVKKKLSTLSAMLTFAIRLGYIERNPMDGVKISAVRSLEEEEKQKYFTVKEAAKFMEILESPLFYSYAGRTRKSKNGKIVQVKSYQSDHAISTQLKLCFYVLIYSGCRRGELISLKWSDINFDDGIIHIKRNTISVDNKQFEKVTKTITSHRDVTVPDNVIALAKQWKKEQESYKKLLGSAWEGEDYVFIQKTGKQMDLGTPYQAFQRIVTNYNRTRKETDVELPMITLHDLRHTNATLLLSSGVDVKTISSRLGHSTVSTTLDIYAHALNETDKKASENLKNILAVNK